MGAGRSHFPVMLRHPAGSNLSKTHMGHTEMLWMTGLDREPFENGRGFSGIGGEETPNKLMPGKRHKNQDYQSVNKPAKM
jgi:hypothetical protein